MSQRSSSPQWRPSFPRHLCMPMPMHNAVAPTLSIHTVSPSSPDPSHPNKKKQPKIKWRLDGCRVDDFRWVLWSIPSCFCDTCCSPTLSETKHPSIIFCTLTVSSPIAFDFSRLRKVQVRYSKFTNCSSSPRPQRIPTNLGNRLEHFRFAGPAPRSAQAPGVFAGESNVVPWVKIYKICN